MFVVSPDIYFAISGTTLMPEAAVNSVAMCEWPHLCSSTFYIIISVNICKYHLAIFYSFVMALFILYAFTIYRNSYTAHFVILVSLLACLVVLRIIWKPPTLEELRHQRRLEEHLVLLQKEYSTVPVQDPFECIEGDLAGN